MANAKVLAKKFNFEYLDTGAMYRCVTLYALEHNVDCQDDEEVCKLLPKLISDEFNCEIKYVHTPTVDAIKKLK